MRIPAFRMGSFRGGLSYSPIIKGVVLSATLFNDERTVTPVPKDSTM